MNTAVILEDMRPVQKIKLKYYSHQALKYLLLAGVVTVTGAGGLLVLHLFKRALRDQGLGPRVDPLVQKKQKRAFYYLLSKGLIEVKREGHDAIIALTKEGYKKAGKYQIDNLALEVPKKWDGKWRLVIFDIPNTSKLARDVLRRKLKEWGFFMLQKSIWIYPYDCQEEIDFLREFLGADRRQIQLLEASYLGDERFLREFFGL